MSLSDLKNVPKLSSFKSIVIGAPNWVGDAVMTEPFLRLLSKRSLAKVTVLCRPRVKDIYKMIENRNRKITVRTYDPGLKKELRIFPGKKTLWINLSLSNDLYRLAKFFRAAHVLGYVIPETSGHVSHPLNAFLFNLGKHNSENYLDILRLWGIAVRHRELPRLVFDANAVREAGETVNRVGLSGKRYIICNTSTSNAESKRYPPRQFVALLRILKRTYPEFTLVLTGLDTDTKERRLFETVGRESGFLNLIGKTSLRNLSQLIYFSRLVISGDTGPMHLSYALGMPTLAIFGSTSPTWTGPLGKNTFIARDNLECMPCMEHHCPLQRQVCFDRLNPARIVNILKKEWNAKNSD